MKRSVVRVPSLVVITSSNMGLGAVLEYPSQFSFDNCPRAELTEIFPISCLLRGVGAAPEAPAEGIPCWDPFSLNLAGMW